MTTPTPTPAMRCARPTRQRDRGPITGKSLGAWPNKAMVPTATPSPHRDPLHPLRRHIGRPLGGSDVRIDSAALAFQDNSE